MKLLYLLCWSGFCGLVVYCLGSFVAEDWNWTQIVYDEGPAARLLLILLAIVTGMMAGVLNVTPFKKEKK